MTLYRKLLRLRENMKLLSNYDRGFVRNVLDGVSGLGEPSNIKIAEYLSEKQMSRIETLYKTVFQE